MDNPICPASLALLHDKISGSMLGGAVGDALGYPVEFLDEQDIFSTFGKLGITSFKLNSHGIAEISDDTQMSLFTANALLCAATRFRLSGFAGPLEDYVKSAYIEWLDTQVTPPAACPDVWHSCWIRNIPELNHRRAPGHTCIEALSALREYRQVENMSKGCGGLMRVAPVGLFAASCSLRGITYDSSTQPGAIGARTARITHKHPLGFLPAALLTHIIFEAALLPPALAVSRLDSIIAAALASLPSLKNEFGTSYAIVFPDEIGVLTSLINEAVALARTDTPDVEAIHSLGEGWVAEQTLAIAVYCCLRHPDDFGKAVVASVNHSGDSDSTGAVTGNIMGAVLGKNAIPPHFLPNLELLPVIEELAADLAGGCPASLGDAEDSSSRNWLLKYRDALLPNH